MNFYIGANFKQVNVEAKAILKEIKMWEEARMNGAFSEAQKEKLRDPFTFYGLVKNGDEVKLIFIELWKSED